MAVSEVAKGIQNRSEFVSFPSKAATAQSNLRKMCDKQENAIKLLQETRESITTIFKDMRRKLNQVLDRLENDSTVHMDRLLSIFKRTVTSDKNMCSNLLDKIQSLLQDIQNVGKHCDDLAFQGYKKCCEQIVKAEHLLICEMPNDYTLQFTPDANIEQFLSSLESLGTFHVTPSHVLVTPFYHKYTAVTKQLYAIRPMNYSNEKCDFTGVCQLSNNCMVLVDTLNIKVKLLRCETFNAHYITCSELKLPPIPYDICHTTGQEVAVTVSDNKGRKEIHFINADNWRLLHTRTIQLDHDCFGIFCRNGQLYVSSSNALNVYNMSGEIIKTLHGDTSAEQTKHRFCFSEDGSMIYVANQEKHSLFTSDSSGKLLSTLSDPELQEPTGICLAPNSSVFVCCKKSNTILQVDSMGCRRMGMLAKRSDGVNNPQSLHYDKNSQTLLVVQSDKILRMQLE